MCSAQFCSVYPLQHNLVTSYRDTLRLGNNPPSTPPRFPPEELVGTRRVNCTPSSKSSYRAIVFWSSKATGTLFLTYQAFIILTPHHSGGVSTFSSMCTHKCFRHLWTAKDSFSSYRTRHSDFFSPKIRVH